MHFGSKFRRRGRTVTAGIIASSIMVSGASFGLAGPAFATPQIPLETTLVSVAPETNSVITEVGLLSSSITLPGELTLSQAAKPGKVPEQLFLGKGEPLLSTVFGGTVISSYRTGIGMQTLISITDSHASHRYEFPLSVPHGTKATIAFDGSVAVTDDSGRISGGYRTPWAYDASGKVIPTSFSLEGNTLVQTIDFDENIAFPIVADPSDFWGWTKCVATVTAEVAVNGLVALKVAKLVAISGSILKVFQKLSRAWNGASTVEKKWKAVLTASGGLAGEILGVVAIREACFES